MDDDVRRHLVGDHRDVLDDRGDDRADVDGFGDEGGGAGIVAGDLEQVREQAVEALGLRVEQLGTAGGDRVEVVAGIVDEVRGRADRRERRAQLVGDVGDELPLKHGQPFHLLDLVLEGVGHVVEALPEHGDLVVAVDGHPLVEVAVGDEPGHLGAGAHGGDDEPGDDPRDRADEDDEDEGGDEHRALDEVERVLLLAEVAQVVELELPRTGDRQLLGDEQARSRIAGQTHRLVEHVIGRGLSDGRLEIVADGHRRHGACGGVHARADRRERGVRVLRLERERVDGPGRPVVDRRQLR
ncbi:Uncharacterised protein [Mycobacteroides abscessus subsp. abscessus]|nr:Uncharacterised protein [Mycobacteroides abscessus subsp. abscessus]